VLTTPYFRDSLINSILTTTPHHLSQTYPNPGKNQILHNYYRSLTTPLYPMNGYSHSFFHPGDVC